MADIVKLAEPFITLCGFSSWLSNDKFDLGLFLLAIGLATMGMGLVLDFSFPAIKKFIGLHLTG